jgi:hypothetical protein
LEAIRKGSFFISCLLFKFDFQDLRGYTFYRFILGGLMAKTIIVEKQKILKHEDLRRCASCARRARDNEFINSDMKFTPYCSDCRRRSPKLNHRVVEIKIKS